jgi:hypothetical protein
MAAGMIYNSSGYSLALRVAIHTASAPNADRQAYSHSPQRFALDVMGRQNAVVTSIIHLRPQRFSQRD